MSHHVGQVRAALLELGLIYDDGNKLKCSRVIGGLVQKNSRMDSVRRTQRSHSLLIDFWTDYCFLNPLMVDNVGRSASAIRSDEYPRKDWQPVLVFHDRGAGTEIIQRTNVQT
jgi:hypothetical protein